MNGNVTTIAGNGTAGFSDNADGSLAQFNYPQGICISPDGTMLFIADKENNRIRKVNINTTSVSTIAGTGVQGETDAPGGFAKFRRPGGVSISNDGNNLYITDTDNHKIRKQNLQAADSAVTTLAGAGFAGGPGWVDGVGIAAKFYNPRSVALSAGDTVLYVTDELNHRIRKIVIASGVVTTIAGTGIAGDANGIGTAAQFSYPNGITAAPDGTSLYVADFGSLKIRKINIANLDVSTLAGSGTSGSANNTVGVLAQFAGPTDIVISPDNTMLFVADRQNNRIRTVEASVVPTTGLPKENLKEVTTIYPTPSTGRFIIKLNSLQEFKELKLAIYNNLGQVIDTGKCEHCKSHDFEFDLSKQSNGIYFINIQSTNSFITEKIILIK
ncbi:MAG TPA: T9SS type A sorting domain-containing protein [Chitinophagaceae bacterium]|nr:T9SS type A sorting domain-containing protein [Chitinophagaceae bacterium]